MQRITVEELCLRYDVYLPHARHVGRLSAELFTMTRPLHQLDERYAEVSFWAGLLHNVAYAGGQKKHHKRGRDILLAQPLLQITDDNRAIIAVTTVFHRKRWKPERLTKESSYQQLPAELQAVARWLAAVVRIADGLDYSHSHTTIISEAEVDPGGVMIHVVGPYVEIDASRADIKADMWRAVIGIPLRVLVSLD